MSSRVHTQAVPVIVGVADVVQRPEEAPVPRHPIELAAEAARLAAKDAGVPDLVSDVDAVDLVNIVGWAYDDPAGQVAAALDARPHHKLHTDVGGHRPTLQLDRAAARIAAGDSGVALVAGGEAMRSLQIALNSGNMPPWPAPPPDAKPVDPRDHAGPYAVARDLLLPTDVYPLYEQGSRAAVGLTQRAALHEAAQRWAQASEVALTNPNAWMPKPVTADDIVTVTERNRMVSWPYPKLLTAQLSVDQAAAVILTSTEIASRLGIPEERWVYPWGGAAANEADDVLCRPTYERTPAGSLALDGAFESAGLTVGDVDLFELYSCFPCVPRMVITHLGLDPDIATTVTGGLTFFGGPGNDYMLHAVVAMAHALRRGDGSVGLLYGQGGYATKHHAVLLSTQAPDGYRIDDTAARQAVADAEPVPAFVDTYIGPGTLETFTMPYDRDGTPSRILLVGRTPEGDRFAGEAPVEADVVATLTDLDAEPLGHAVVASVVARSQRVDLS